MLTLIYTKTQVKKEKNKQISTNIYIYIYIYMYMYIKYISIHIINHIINMLYAYTQFISLLFRLFCFFVSFSFFVSFIYAQIDRFRDYKLGFLSLVETVTLSICLNILIFIRKLLIFKIFIFHEFIKRFLRGLFILKLCIGHFKYETLWYK